MSKAKAAEFIEKFFSDDAFVEEAVRKNGGMYTGRNSSQAESNEEFVKMGKVTGYDFTAEEHEEALKEYFEGKGFGGFRRLIHAGRLATKVNKQIEKESK